MNFSLISFVKNFIFNLNQCWPLVKYIRIQLQQKKNTYKKKRKIFERLI